MNTIVKTAAELRLEKFTYGGLTRELEGSMTLCNPPGASIQGPRWAVEEAWMMLARAHAEHKDCCNDC
jgi:hypothetical protein